MPSRSSRSPPTRCRRCSIPRGQVTPSRAASWATWPKPATAPPRTCAAPWCTARPWGPSRSSSSGSGVRGRHPRRRAGASARVQGAGALRGGAVTDRYAAAGVHLDAAEEARRRIAELARTTRTPLALGRLGAFGGMVRVPAGFERPVLVLSTDGVGTKVLVAARAGVHDTGGEDLVNHCVNDVLVHGARPLAFLDYLATAELEPETAAAIVSGVARGCRAHDMILAGGETAQLPDLYQPGHYDLAGAILGVGEGSAALQGDLGRAGDVLIGYASNGLR